MSEGQISENSMMTPQQGADSVPGTDDGVPPADVAQQVPQGMPEDSSQDAADRSGVPSDEDDLGGAT
ncbi:hypothetical protein [Luteococcus sediminum]